MGVHSRMPDFVRPVLAQSFPPQDERRKASVEQFGGYADSASDGVSARDWTVTGPHQNFPTSASRGLITVEGT